MIAPEPLAPCASCGRRLPAEDLVFTDGGLVCEPCQAEGAKAELRRDSIDAAWKAVEAVKGYRVVELREIPADDELPVTLWFAAARRGDEPKPCATDRTPDRALRQLAAKLAEEA